jgi:hypothetical protein
MTDFVDRHRRLLLGAALSGVATRAFAQAKAPPRAPSSRRMEPLRQVDAGVLNIAYYEAGPADGPVAILLHGFPYDIHSYVDVAPQLAAQGCRVIVPYLRGFGATRFRDAATLRSGEQAAIGADVIALMDALRIPRRFWRATIGVAARPASPRRCGRNVAPAW